MSLYLVITSPPIGGGRGTVIPMSVCIYVYVYVCTSVCKFIRVCANFKYFQNFRSNVKVVGRLYRLKTFCGQNTGPTGR